MIDYAHDVHTAAQAWIDKLSAMALDSKPESAWRLQHLAGLHPDEAGWLFEMWDQRTVAWFVRWECIGHAYTHLGEMYAVRNRLLADRA